MFNEIETTSAERIGRRIRIIRVSRGLSQTELGSMVGLSADRIQKYENGVRKPKTELLKIIASALGVNVLALMDPTLETPINAMFMLFELENDLNMKIEKFDSKLCLTIDAQNEIYPHVLSWYKEHQSFKAELEAATSDREKLELYKEYKFWKWMYPNSLLDEATQDAKRKRLENKIEELKAKLDELNSEDK